MSRIRIHLTNEEVLSYVNCNPIMEGSRDPSVVSSNYNCFSQGTTLEIVVVVPIYILESFLLAPGTGAWKLNTERTRL
jgi:hypothetical protein